MTGGGGLDGQGIPDDDGLLYLSGEAAGEQDASTADAFFVSKKAAAVLKHEILEQYVIPFASKVGRYSPDGRVVYLDGYAGPGRYDDGTEGSPALILNSAARVSAFRQLDCYFVERGRAEYRQLASLVAEAEEDGLKAEALKGKLEKHLDYVLSRAQGAPLLAFIDPFGLGLSFDDLTKKLFGSRQPVGATGKDATEVLLNFNANAIRRIGGLLESPKETPGKPATLAAMDAACGGDWWRDEYRAAQGDNREAVKRIVSGFAKRVGAAVKAGYWIVAVRNRAHHQPAYHLVFFTRHKDGLLLFGEATSLAQARWRKECLPPPVEGMLFNDVDMFDAEEKKRETLWIEEIKRNIEALMAERGSFVVGSFYPQVMGEALGEARQKHIRAAVKQLYKEGKTDCKGTGDVPALLVTPPKAK